jgi:hypothetical protein
MRRRCTVTRSGGVSNLVFPNHDLDSAELQIFRLFIGHLHPRTVHVHLTLYEFYHDVSAVLNLFVCRQLQSERQVVSLIRA